MRVIYDPNEENEQDWQPPAPEPNYLPNGQINMHVYGLLNPGDPGYDQQRDPEWRTGSDAPFYEEELPYGK